MKALASNQAKVAVLLATFNGAEWIEKQIRSIHTQTKVSVYLTVSDDGSTDGTFEWLKNHADCHSLTLLPAKKTGGASQNFFRLLIDTDLSAVDYVALSDQDDIWLPDKLNRAIEMIQIQNVDAYSANVLAFWPDGRKVLIDKAQPQKVHDYLFESAGPGCSFLLSQKLALDLQSFLRANYQNCVAVALHDWFSYAFARSKGYKWFIDTAPRMLYRQHTHNAVGANAGLKAFIARLKTLKQGWYIQQILLMAKILGYQDQMPIRRILRLNFLDKLYLASHACQFRRRLRDQFAFAFYILFLARKP